MPASSRPGKGAGVYADAYASQIAHDGAGNLNGVVASSLTTHDVPSYSTPKWNELVIYELHIRPSSTAAAIAARGWSPLDGCTGTPSAPDSNGCSTYSQCKNRVEVTLCTTQGGGHVTGNPQLGWAMLKKHPMP
jgi:poly(3-hydroxybutyrate) depolymerase